MKTHDRIICWLGLVASLMLLGLSIWFHVSMDTIIRIPFVLGTAVIGLIIGLNCLFRLITNR